MKHKDIADIETETITDAVKIMVCNFQEKLQNDQWHDFPQNMAAEILGQYLYTYMKANKSDENQVDKFTSDLCDIMYKQIKTVINANFARELNGQSIIDDVKKEKDKNHKEFMENFKY